MNSSYDVIGNTPMVASIYFQHEKGTDEALATGTVTAITSNIESGDFDITAQSSYFARSNKQVLQPFQGDGEYIMKIRRFIPDFLSQSGNTQVTLQLRDYPND